MLTSKTKVKQTSRGFRVWIEGSNLDYAGFKPNKRFNLNYGANGLILTLHPEGKRKVSNSQRDGRGRPIIDIESKKVGKYFGENAELNVCYLPTGSIVIYRAGWHQPENRQIRFDEKSFNVSLSL